MKALIITNMTTKIREGHFSMIEPLQEMGYEVHWVSNFSHYKDDLKKSPVKLFHINFYRNPLNLKNVLAYIDLLKLLKIENYKVIHCNNPIGGVLGRLCGKRAKIPKIIYTAHGFHFHKDAPLINRTIFKWVEMWLARYTDAIITINHEDNLAAKKFKLREGGKVYYIPGVGIDTSLISYAKSKREEISNQIGASEDSILLISIGELNKNKNNKVIIKALDKIKNPKIHYLLCGVGDKNDELHSLAKEYGLEKNIHFLQYRSDIPELLKSCDIFVMPSFREGLSRALMEAMSAGLPCIVSNIRGNVDLIEEGIGGFLRDPDDSEGFAEAINILALDNELRKKMKESNLEAIKKFDVKNIKKEMKRIYERELI